ILGNERDPFLDRVAGTADERGSAAQPDLARYGGLDAGDQPSERASSAAEEAGDAKHLAAAKAEAGLTRLVRTAHAIELEDDIAWGGVRTAQISEVAHPPADNVGNDRLEAQLAER